MCMGFLLKVCHRTCRFPSEVLKYLEIKIQRFFRLIFLLLFFMIQNAGSCLGHRLEFGLDNFGSEKTQETKVFMGL